MRSVVVTLVAGCAAVLATACSDHERPSTPPQDPPRQRRVIEPPAGTVRPQPPYAIRADGVGPYRLGDKLSDLLEQLPSGPRIALFDIPNLLHRSLIRAEDDTVLIGGEPTSSVTFVAVIGKDVARTESGIHVGSTRDELAKALGPLVEDPDRAHDPRLVVPSGLPNARIILEGDRIAAIVVTSEPVKPVVDSTCPRPAATAKGFGSCLTGAGELIEIDGDEIAVHAPESERTIATLRIPNLVFAAPLRNPSEGRDELVAITRTDEPGMRSWLVVAYRFEGGRIVRAVDPTPLYQVSSSNARWIGADLRDVDLYLELSSRTDAIDVGGVLTTHPDGEAKPQGSWRDVVVISPVAVTRRRGKSAASEGSGAPAPDAPSEPAGSGSAAGSSGAGRSKQ